MAADADLQRYFSDLPFKVKRRLATVIKAEADKLASAIRAKAPRGETGNLAASVQVRRKKSETQLEVTAGGDLTTRVYERSTDYDSAVIVDGRDNSGKSKVPVGKGAGVSYDYSRAKEFGTVNSPAEPFFFNTYREMAPDIRQAIDDAVADAFNS